MKLFLILVLHLRQFFIVRIFVKRATDLQIGKLECIWLVIQIKNKTYLYGTFHIPPNSNLQTWDELDQSIDLALNNTHDIIITGDFNLNQLSDNHRNKISSLLTQYSFQQLITEPTYMTEHSSSLLDLAMVNNPTSVLNTEVAPPPLVNTSKIPFTYYWCSKSPDYSQCFN